MDSLNLGMFSKHGLFDRTRYQGHLDMDQMSQRMFEQDQIQLIIIWLYSTSIYPISLNSGYFN